MNYRHAYHAGNHADVLKHLLLTHVIDGLKQKEKPFAALDAHAGAGGYDLAGPEAFKTSEWREGVQKLLASDMPPALAPLFADYTGILNEMNPSGRLRHYPGSPEILRRLLRLTDRMVLNELHQEEADKLKANCRDDRRVRLTRVDALQSIKTELPFPERRGLVLIDPAFEQPDEQERIDLMVSHALRRMANAVIMIWYPIKTEAAADSMAAMLGSIQADGILSCELRVREPFKEGGLTGSGIVVINPPYKFAEKAEALLPFLAEVLGVGRWGRGGLRWLRPPR